MKRWTSSALRAAALSALIVLSSASTAFGKHRLGPGDYYGFGVEGTIGRGTYVLPGGPLDWKGPGPSSGLRSGANAPTLTYSSGYSSAPARPYLTTRTYAPGDGYRYPLYYDPASGTYFFFPVGRR